jgi:hypothetical protein
MSKYVTFAMQGNSNYPIFRHMLVKLSLDFAQYKQFSRTLTQYLIKVFENARSIIFENTRSILKIFENARSQLADLSLGVKSRSIASRSNLQLARYTMLTFIRAVLYMNIVKFIQLSSLLLPWDIQAHFTIIRSRFSWMAEISFIGGTKYSLA